MSRPESHVGAPVERVEDDRLLRGRGCYVADVVLPGMLHAVIRRSEVAHARLTGIDAAAARDAPGVVAVLTAADIAGPVPLIPIRQQALPEGEPYRQPVIAVDRLRYVGEPVAVVVATSAAEAEDAAALIEVATEPLPAVADAEASLAGPALFDAPTGNMPLVFTAERGDADAAFRAAAYTRRERFSTQRHTALPMETRGLVAQWDPAAQHLTVHGAAKVPFFNRQVLAGMLGLETAAVDLIEVDVGGGFGARGEFYPEDFLIAFAARRLGATVRWIEDRREHLMAMNHAREMSAEMEIACDADGTMTGLRGRILVDLGAYVRTNGFTAVRNVAQFTSGPYRVPHVHIEALPCMTSKTPSGTYRGPGRFEASFVVERLLDLAAADLGLDRADIRRRNLARPTDMPFKMPKMRHVDPSAETWCDSGDYAEILRRCLDAFDWTARQAQRGPGPDGRFYGTGLGCFIEGGAAGPRESARIEIAADGGVILSVGSSALGQGLATVLSQIAADALDLPIGAIRVRHGSTTLVREGFGSFHSRSTVMGGNAVLQAAAALKVRLAAEAPGRMGVDPASVEASGVALAGGTVRAGNAVRPLAAFAGLAVEESFANAKHTYSYGAHAAQVAVHPRTGHVEVLDYLSVDDVGRVINPLTLHGQVLGSIVQGLGSVFLEQIHYDGDGQILTGTLADYRIATATDFPAIRGLSFGLCPSPNNPLGAKGAGEGGLIAVGGVVANAIADALRPLDVRPHHLPLTPPRLWRLIRDARAAHSETETTQ